MIATHDREVKSKKNKRRLRLLQDLTWNDFCKIKKSRSCSLTVADKSETNKEVTKEIEIRVADLTQKSDWPIPSSVSLGEESLTGASRIQDDAAFVMCSGNFGKFLRRS
ncbi:hypothetical protein EZV62_006017 [Acer yangbiense]|uniref:Uncharacterized protein n=1 Tax=Acer yangbiense TaxID=1000413 RepID=A0A5C7IRV9_9ROSI|nr:hypothetical protein EZV62_006017 [Acer yangbiense]